jgi:hypothetical protein
MGQLAIPIAIGAAIGGGTQLVQGKGLGDILKGAALGGGTGAITGGIGGATAGGASGATLSSIDPLSSGVGAFTDGLAGAATDPLTGQMLASQVPDMGVQAFTQQPTMFDKISPYLDVRDLSGAAMNAFNQPQQQQQVPSGNVAQGRAPQGNDVMSLLQSMKLPERKRLTLL